MRLFRLYFLNCLFSSGLCQAGASQLLVGQRWSTLWGQFAFKNANASFYYHKN